MPLNLNHIGGVCLSILKLSPSSITKLVFLLMVVSLTKIVLVWVKNFLFRKKLRIIRTPKVIKELCLKHDLLGKVKIVNDKKLMAFCLGIRHPHIYLSNRLIAIMSKSELEVILLHEKYHLLNSDTLSIMLISQIKHFLFFLPIVSDFIDGLIRQKETQADQYGLSYVRKSSVFISAFKKLIFYNLSQSPTLSYVATFTNIDTLEHRIKTLRGKKSLVLSFKIKHIVITLLFAFAAITFLLYSHSSVQAQESPDEKPPLVCLKGHNCHSDCSSK